MGAAASGPAMRVEPNSTAAPQNSALPAAAAKNSETAPPSTQKVSMRTPARLELPPPCDFSLEQPHNSFSNAALAVPAPAVAGSVQQPLPAAAAAVSASSTVGMVDPQHDDELRFSFSWGGARKTPRTPASVASSVSPQARVSFTHAVLVDDAAASERRASASDVLDASRRSSSAEGHLSLGDPPLCVSTEGRDDFFPEASSLTGEGELQAVGSQGQVLPLTPQWAKHRHQRATPRRVKLGSLHDSD